MLQHWSAERLVLFNQISSSSVSYYCNHLNTDYLSCFSSQMGNARYLTPQLKMFVERQFGLGKSFIRLPPF